MIIGIIKNQNNSYEYLFEHNGKIKCFHLDKNGFSNSNSHFIKNILQNVFNINNYTYIKDYLDYQIYYDDKTQLHHFIKDKEEDLNYFINYNGKNVILFNNKNNHQNFAKKILIAGLEVLLFTSIAGITYFKNIDNIIIDDNIPNETIEEINKKISYLDAIDAIESSAIDNDLKEQLINTDLLIDVFNYYQDSAMEYLIKMKLQNIQLDYYEPDYANNMGYYNLLEPNIIHISKEYKNDRNEVKRIATHEYNHMLQAADCEYRYLLEAGDELILKEYYGMDIISYNAGVKNLMLLIDIAGPQPVMNLLYNNPEQLEIILKNNLEEEDYNTLTNYFKDSELCNGHNQENKEIRLILCKLYKNMYNQDIKDDKNILYNIVYKDNIMNSNQVTKYFLNYHKMSDIEFIQQDSDTQIGVESIKTRFNHYQDKMTIDNSEPIIYL